MKHPIFTALLSLALAAPALHAQIDFQPQQGTTAQPGQRQGRGGGPGGDRSGPAGPNDRGGSGGRGGPGGRGDFGGPDGPDDFGDPRGFGGPGGGPRGGRGAMTPEQRSQRRVQGALQMLVANNFADAALQDAVAAFVTQSKQSRQILRDTTQRLAAAMDDEATTNAQLAALLADWRVAKAAEETRRQSALKALDAKINFSANPRLEALLLLSGITGDAPMGGGPGGFGGPRGRGRFNGPPPGGD